MNPGPVEEAGKVATTAFDALKGYPAFLMMAIIQILLVVGVLYAVHERNTMFEKQFELLLQHCKPA